MGGGNEQDSVYQIKLGSYHNVLSPFNGTHTAHSCTPNGNIVRIESPPGCRNDWLL